jgi:hypothetical protein
MVVLTIEGEGEGADVKFEVRLESLMCPKSSNGIDDRMSLLWHSRTNTLTKLREISKISTATSDFGAGERKRRSVVIPGRFGSRLLQKSLRY